MRKNQSPLHVLKLFDFLRHTAIFSAAGQSVVKEACARTSCASSHNPVTTSLNVAAETAVGCSAEYGHAEVQLTRALNTKLGTWTIRSLPVDQRRLFSESFNLSVDELFSSRFVRLESVVNGQRHQGAEHVWKMKIASEPASRASFITACNCLVHLVKWKSWGEDVSPAFKLLRHFPRKPVLWRLWHSN